MYSQNYIDFFTLWPPKFNKNQQRMASFSLQNNKNKNSKIYQRGFMNLKYMHNITRIWLQTQK